MKKIFGIALFTATCIQLNATTLFQQLCAFNPNWKNYPMHVSAYEECEAVSEQAYVALHLAHVLPILQSNSTVGLNDAQLNMRTSLINVLDGYRLAGQFPLNDYVQKRTPVFIDRYNTYCAVGYLMRASGYNDLALAIANDNNLAWVKEIRVAGIAAWQELSGFTLDELKLIQGAYDYYYPDAFLLPNKYEVPQKPEVVERYFEDEFGRPGSTNIWCKGEGSGGILNGKWIQQYSAKFPWIEGYYSSGKRTGQWKEFYPNSALICRTENWRNDKLNGVRKRFDRDGKLIEEILFVDGVAVTKTNHDLLQGMTFIRTPLDSSSVYTHVYTTDGGLIAEGKETIYNPGNLKWFQNIELTALNSLIQTTRDETSSYYPASRRRSSQPALFGNQQLVEYKKEGEWTYYRQYGISKQASPRISTIYTSLMNDYPHYGESLYAAIAHAEDPTVTGGYDSLHVEFKNNIVQEFLGYGSGAFIHLALEYYEATPMLYLSNDFPYDLRTETHLPVLKRISVYNQSRQRFGVWKYFNNAGSLVKTENYLVATDEEEHKETAAVPLIGDAWKP